MAQDYSQFKKELQMMIMDKATFYQDFPKPGVNFMDLFSLTSQPEVFDALLQGTIRVIDEEIGKDSFNTIIGLESRGFIMGPLLAHHYRVPFLPIRKKGKLPGECHQYAYGTEYSQDICEI